jgi:hypothetical protein
MSLELNEHREHAEHAAHAVRDPFVGRVSITIAMLAVLAAVTNSLEQVETAKAITDSSRAVLAQNQASDQWAYYQAKSMKKHIYTLAADEGFPSADLYRKTAAKEAADSDAVTKQAQAFEKKREAFNEGVELHETRHHRLAAGGTLMEIGIAIATVAIITRRNAWWLAAALLGVGGTVLAAGGYLGFGLF